MGKDNIKPEDEDEGTEDKEEDRKSQDMLSPQSIPLTRCSNNSIVSSERNKSITSKASLNSTLTLAQVNLQVCFCSE